MSVREKLIEILEEPCGGLYPACELADYLIANGVTVQELNGSNIFDLCDILCAEIGEQQ